MNEAGRYQIQVAGPVTKRASGGGANVDADGIRVETCSLLDAKHVGSESSPYLPGTAAFALGFAADQTRDEFSRYGTVDRAPETPVTNLVVITNDERAVPVFTGWINDAAAHPASVEVQECAECS